jgi:3D (Asp-Asp-Asp) domain-containing protein
MKKNVALILISVLLISFTNKINTEEHKIVLHPKAVPDKLEVPEYTKVGDTFIVTATMYYPVEGQCDSDPLTTAGMYQIDPYRASEHKWIAMSRDLIQRWGGDFTYGDYVLIEGADNKDGIYMVADTMNKRFKNKIDILETKGTSLYKFDNVKITKIEKNRNYIAQNF